MQKILIFDTTLRDGEQSPGASLNVQEKLIIAKQLAKLNVDIIEAGFPISSDGDFEAVKLIAKNVKGPVICGLARAVKEDIDRAWEAIKYSKKPRIHTFIATSQIHMSKKLRKSKEEVIQMTIDAVKHAKKYCKDVEFSPEDAARTDMDYMCDVVRAAIKAGATTINIPDTVGYAEPEEFGNRIKFLFDNVPEAKNIVVSCHCHDDLGLAVANSLTAIRNGATQAECTINGIGERAGNASMEEIIMNLKTRSDYFKEFYTSIRTKEIYKTSRMVSGFTGLAVQRNKAIVGGNAFAHEAGIHQHGVISDKSTYEIMRAEDVGWIGEGLVMGKHSGTHAAEVILKEMDYNFSKEQINSVMDKIKELADKQKEVMREDIIAIANDVAGSLTKEERTVVLDEIKISTGNKITPTAIVMLKLKGKAKKGSGKGVGPVDAVCNAIRAVIGPNIKLKEYNLKAITGGTDALADVIIKIEDKNKNLFKAEAVDEDVIMASTKAFIQGINKAMNFKKPIKKKEGSTI
jgi:2-isopropylmalate synthase